MNKKIILDSIDMLFDKQKKLADIESLKLDDRFNAINFDILYSCDFGMENWDWPQGVGLYGLNKFNVEQETDKFSDFLIEWFKSKDIKKEVKNINTCSPMYTLTKIDKSDLYKDDVLEWCEYLMTELPKTDENCFQHVTSNFTNDGVNLNEDQIWIDTLFMALLFLNEAGIKYDINKYQEEARYQLLQHIKYLYCKETKLFYHGYNFQKKSNYGAIHWCRGNSWFTCGMVDFLEQAEKGNENDPIFRYILELLKNQVDALMALQGKEGLWKTVLLDEDSYIETSGSAAILAAVLKGIRLGYLPESYKEPCMHGIDSLITYIDYDGALLNTSVGTGIGDDKEFYNDIAIAPMAYGQSLAIIALSESLNHLED